MGTYASEFVSNTYRGPFLSIQGVFWMVGQLLCGALAWIVIPQHSIDMLGLMTIHSWRLFIAISALPSVFSAILYYFMPESPRYLLEVLYRLLWTELCMPLYMVIINLSFCTDW